MLRRHQQEFKEIIDGIIQGSGVKKVYVHVVPGGGKSLIPILAGKLITKGFADALCWVAPRLALAHQAETNFLEKTFREMLNHSLTIRSATNEKNPCRDQDGFVTTYQALGVDEKQTVSKDFSTKRYILILDEFHHTEEGGPWHKALQPLVDKAEYLILLTGTLERGDGDKIAFIPYRKTATGLEPYLDSGSDTAVIRYGREDALKEKAILPLRFMLSDAHVEWETKEGSIVSGALSSRKIDAGAAIYTALETGFAEELLQNGLDHWQRYRAFHNPCSKLLVVTANIEHAKKFTGILKAQGFNAEIATSHDSVAAINAIKRFKGNALDILVSVAMIYEGFDCKPLTHIVSLTHVRSTPWILQMISRAVRVDPYAGPYEAQQGFIFAPDDYLFRGVVNRIKAEQLACASEIPKGQGDRKGGNGNGKAGPDIIPIGSRLTGRREFEFCGIPDGTPIVTIKETEENILSKIENHVRAFTFTYYYKPGRINTEIKAEFGKPRREMGLKELRRVYEYVTNTYPLNGNGPIEGISRPRGHKRRVPTRAIPWEG